MYGKQLGNKNFQQYRQLKVQSASPGQLMLMLYDGAIRFCLRAIKQMEIKDVAGKGMSISKAQAIVQELAATLNFQVAPELCASLEQLYIYMTEKLTEANMDSDAEKIKEVVRLLTTVKEGWEQVVKQEAKSGQPRPAPQPGQQMRPAPGSIPVPIPPRVQTPVPNSQNR
jgi:flagellar protein FliS